MFIYDKKIEPSDIERVGKSDIGEHLETLCQMANIRHKSNILELGVRDGHSTLAFLAAVNLTNGHLYSVDTKNCSNLFNPTLNNWTFIIGNSTWVEINKKFDIIFIDTEHTYETTKTELRKWQEKLVVGGYFVLHDSIGIANREINERGNPVLSAIHDVLLIQEGRYTFENKNYCNGLAILQKLT